MNPIETIVVSRMGELVLRAWKVGIVYFQVFDSKPNPEFYVPLSDMKPYEQIVEIPTRNLELFKSQVSFTGKAPFFGAVTGGWFIIVSDDPKDADEIVREARRCAILPTDELPSGTAGDDITLEGCGGPEE